MANIKGITVEINGETTGLDKALKNVNTSIALGLMANAGIKASQAGTSLRTGLTNMAKPTRQIVYVAMPGGRSFFIRP